MLYLILVIFLLLNKKIVDLVTSVGITPEIVNGYIHEAHAIGAFTGSNPLTMAGAYQIFSNGGYFFEPYSVNKVIFRDTGEEFEYSSPKVKIISDSTAYMITDVLKAVPNGTTKSGLGRDHFAAKTGTTNVDSATKRKNGYPSSIVRDYWIMGYTHDTVIGIWIGYDKLNKTHYLNYNQDGGLRHGLLNLVAKVAFNHDGKDFVKPNSVVAAKVEKGTNPPKAPSANTPSDQIITELFKRGTEPSEVSTKYLAVSAPTNFSVTDHNSYVSLSWNAVSDPDYVDDGVFGYYVYFNGEKKGFTRTTTYTISNLSSYYGTYSVRAGYQDANGKDLDTGLSSATSFELKARTCSLTLNGKSSVTYTVGDNIDKSLYDGSIVNLTCNGGNVTSSANISITITDANGHTVSSINSDAANTYTVTYRVSYDNYTGTKSNTINIKAKEIPQDPTPQQQETST